MSRLGFGPAKASDLYLTDARSINKFVHDAYGPRIAEGTEFFALMSLDEMGKVIQTNVLAEGAPGYVAVSVKDFLFMLDFANKSSGGRLTFYALAHNHPSGSPDPSPDDRYMTHVLQDRILRYQPIYMVSHVIVTAKKSVFGEIPGSVKIKRGKL